MGVVGEGTKMDWSFTSCIKPEPTVTLTAPFLYGNLYKQTIFISCLPPLLSLSLSLVKPPPFVVKKQLGEASIQMLDSSIFMK